MALARAKYCGYELNQMDVAHPAIRAAYPDERPRFKDLMPPAWNNNGSPREPALPHLKGTGASCKASIAGIMGIGLAALPVRVSTSTTSPPMACPSRALVSVCRLALSVSVVW